MINYSMQSFLLRIFVQQHFLFGNYFCDAVDQLFLKFPVVCHTVVFWLLQLHQCSFLTTFSYS